MNCPFCGVKDRIILENETAYCILSNPRLVAGHSLVIPKRHVEYPGELTQNEIKNIFSLIEIVRANLLDSELATGVDIRQNYRPFLDQSKLKIDHVHFHVIPRTYEDELYERSMRFEPELFQDLDSKEAQEVAGIINKPNKSLQTPAATGQ